MRLFIVNSSGLLKGIPYAARYVQSRLWIYIMFLPVEWGETRKLIGLITSWHFAEVVTKNMEIKPTGDPFYSEGMNIGWNHMLKNLRNAISYR